MACRCQQGCDKLVLFDLFTLQHFKCFSGLLMTKNNLTV